MNGKTAVLVFLVVCVLLALLLLLGTIKPIMASVLFAVALVVLGVPSRGFRRRRL